MNNVIKAYEVVIGCSYRLFPNGKRSRYIVGKCVGVRNRHPIFLYTDPDTKINRIIDNVDLLENVQFVSANGMSLAN